jgi:hypothetical protein
MFSWRQVGFDPLTQLELRDSALNSLTVDLPEPDLLMRQKHKVLGRFLSVLEPLLGVYSIPQTSLHIFADKEMRFIITACKSEFSVWENSKKNSKICLTFF